MENNSNYNHIELKKQKQVEQFLLSKSTWIIAELDKLQQEKKSKTLEWMQCDSEYNNKVKITEDNSNLFYPNSKYEFDINQLKEKSAKIELELHEIEQRIKVFQDEKSAYDDMMSMIEELYVSKLTDPSYQNGNNASHFYEDSNDFTRMEMITLENERKRIARDLHDTTVQTLTGMVHKIELCQQIIDIDPNRTKLELNVIKDSLRSIINDMRIIIFGLRPMLLNDLGLIPAVQSLLDNIKYKHSLQTKLDVINEEVKLSDVFNLSLFRVIQEASNNTIKHAKATTFSVAMEYNKEYLMIKISDNGVGFSLDEENYHGNEYDKHFGLSIMEERIHLLSGTLQFKTKHNEGTLITIKLPYALK